MRGEGECILKKRILIFVALMLFICNMLVGCATKEPTDNDLRSTEYDSIEALHADFLLFREGEGDFGQGYWPRELVTYFPYRDKYFVICTYAQSKNDELALEDVLMVYTVSKRDDKFIFDTDEFGLEVATFSILEGDPENNMIGVCTIKGEMMHVSFVCKEYGDGRCYYYDGVRMDEVEFIDPFSNEKKVLCYGVSDSISSLQVLLGIDHKWQLIPDSPTNYIEYCIHYNSDCIKVVIDVPTMPTSDEFLIEYTNILADEIETSECAQKVLNGGRVDRRQLYAEIKLHIVGWNWGLLKSKTVLADIEIFDGGAVIDSRSWLNSLALSLYGDEYTE